jgi:hypothetical protein
MKVGLELLDQIGNWSCVDGVAIEDNFGRCIHVPGSFKAASSTGSLLGALELLGVVVSKFLMESFPGGPRRLDICSSRA